MTTSSTDLYYEQNASEFIARTFELDMTEQQTSFTAHLMPGSVVLDLGCGSGRDSLAFAKNGYKVIGVDKSSHLVAHLEEQAAQQQVKLDCFEFDMLNLSQWDSLGSVDGIYSMASLVHFKEHEVLFVLKQIAAKLNQSGVLYLTLKAAQTGQYEEGVDQYGRFFSYWTKAAVKQLFALIPELSVEFGEDKDSLGRYQTWITVCAVKK